MWFLPATSPCNDLHLISVSTRTISSKFFSCTRRFRSVPLPKSAMLVTPSFARIGADHRTENADWRRRRALNSNIRISYGSTSSQNAALPRLIPHLMIQFLQFAEREYALILALYANDELPIRLENQKAKNCERHCDTVFEKNREQQADNK